MLKYSQTRRSFIRAAMVSIAGISLAGCYLSKKPSKLSRESLISSLGPLLPPDDNGLMLPRGFTSRVIARSGLPLTSGIRYAWHSAPDGGATFPTKDGGWIYVSNSEERNNKGGVGAVRFDAAGNIVQAYSILENTNLNCAGGATSWGTWLSCEEAKNGMVWECDPYGKEEAVPLPALGVFAHEAVTLDVKTNYLYLTEDRGDGGFYRFEPDTLNSEGRPDLSRGSLKIAVVNSSTNRVNWLPVPDPSAAIRPTRHQLPSSTRFKGGEGIVSYKEAVFFATKKDNRIWSYNTKTDLISVVYDANTHPNPILTGVDNIALTQGGELVVGEDGGDLQVVAITHNRDLVPLVQLVGHDASEITGPAFSPDGKRLYFSSQRGVTGRSRDGMTFEVLGPFHA